MFGLTVASTFFMGTIQAEGFHWGSDLGGGDVSPWRALFDAASFSLSMVGILLAHEMGHYLTAKKYGIDATPPFFIPAPFFHFGTLGAFIRMRLEEKVEADGFMRMAAYGPIWGFVVCIPVVFVGVSLSQIGPAVDPDGTALFLGEPILMQLAQSTMLPALEPGQDVWLHPMAFAGWGGLFVTALNLMPVGQLDGGHVSYGLLGDTHNRIAPALFGVFLAMTVFVWSGWLLMCLFVYLMGVRHPPICTGLPVRGQARHVGLATIVIFCLSFTPIPISGFPTLFEWITG